MTIQITRPRLLVVEGTEERLFFEALIRHYDFTRGEQARGLGGLVPAFCGRGPRCGMCGELLSMSAKARPACAPESFKSVGPSLPGFQTRGREAVGGSSAGGILAMER